MHNKMILKGQSFHWWSRNIFCIVIYYMTSIMTCNSLKNALWKEYVEVQREISTACCVWCVCGFIYCIWKGCCCRKENRERGRRNRDQKQRDRVKKSEWNGRARLNLASEELWIPTARESEEAEREALHVCLPLLLEKMKLYAALQSRKSCKGCSVPLHREKRGTEMRREDNTIKRVCVYGSGHMLIKTLLHSHWAFDCV